MSDQRLETFSARRLELGEALATLEQALARPVGNEADWRRTVGAALVELDTLANMQADTLLSPSGPLTEAVLKAPRLSDRADAIRDEIPSVREQLASARTDLDTIPAQELREILLPILGAIVRLRQSVADVLWEAYNVDIGGPG